jgi:hypothetical protein
MTRPAKPPWKTGKRPDTFENEDEEEISKKQTAIHEIGWNHERTAKRPFFTKRLLSSRRKA